ncbi:MAG: polyprenyl synthetase family protein [Bacteroidaceae bacterium]|nr:polyprenyl synthetase family protein [Bacteroidaceae bacterium]
MDKLAEIRRPIEAELKEYRAIFEQTLKHENPLLRVALEHLLNRQGKMMRPMLVLLAAKFVGEVNERVLHAAVSLELLHTASLVHDDVVDESDRRRGQKSVNALLDNKAAVLVGDFLLSKALYHAAATGSNRVVTWVSELGQTLADGELLQLANLDISDISEENYFEVISKKTASLFATCAKAGALLAGGGEEVVSELEDFGQKVGVCFQMRDDLLDFDNQHDTGKPAGNDMKEGKLTLPVIHALLKTGDEAMRALALKVRRGEASDEEINSLVRFTIDNEGLSYTEKILDKIAYGSTQVIRLSERNSIVADALLKFVSFVVGRDV